MHRQKYKVHLLICGMMVFNSLTRTSVCKIKQNMFKTDLTYCASLQKKLSKLTKQGWILPGGLPALPHPANRGQCVSTPASLIGCSNWNLIFHLHICPACGTLHLCVNIFGSVRWEGPVSQHAPTAANIFVCLTVCFYFWEFDLTLVISRADLW